MGDSILFPSWAKVIKQIGAHATRLVLFDPPPFFLQGSRVCFHQSLALYFSIDRSMPSKCAQSTAEAYSRLKLKGTESNLVNLLMSLSCWGLISWAIAQRIAIAVCEDNSRADVSSHPDLVNLSRLGNQGQHTGHVRRDAMVLYKPSPELVKLQPVLAPCLKTKAVDRTEPAWVWMPMILPNLLFDSLFHGYPKQFKSFLGDGLENFWAKVTCEPRV